MSEGLSRGDMERYDRYFWELPSIGNEWAWLINPPAGRNSLYAGRDKVFLWENGAGSLATNPSARVQGQATWGKRGIFIGRSSDLKATLTDGHIHAQSGVAIVPKKTALLPSLWAFCESPQFALEVRKLNTKILIPTGVLADVPFDHQLWEKAAQERYPNGLPNPYSNDPTQWIFHGHPQFSSHPLQVAVARLVGYRWPVEQNEKMELSDEALKLVSRSRALDSHADKDGIVCIPAVGREAAGSTRLMNLLVAAYGDAWTGDTLPRLLAASDHGGKSLETWLRNKFFTQHSALFGNRPFVWHVWDGLPDGFSALINYHKLDHKALESLIFTYLGDWISRQKRDLSNRIDGAQEKVAAAEALKKRLELILGGEAPFDIFVRWKPTAEQPVAWNPDLNDGVRLNIRPFLSVMDVQKKGAGVLRDKPKGIDWGKDRGSDAASTPWYELGRQLGGKAGDRINDHHLTLREKLAARSTTK
jgi:hypothetical protein